MLTIDLPLRPWSAWPPAAQWAMLAGVLCVAGLGLLGQRQWQQRALGASHAQLRMLQSQWAETRAARDAAEKRPSGAGLASGAQAPMEPAFWPSREQGVDGWVRVAAHAAAEAAGVSLQQLSVTYPEPPAGGGEPAPVSYAVLQVSARGSYAALKTWQARMQQLPSLGVERLRWQTPPSDGSGHLSADWTWRLWLKPGGGGALAAPPLAGAPAPLRPLLAEARRDPFGMTAPPPPPAPVAAYVPPPAPAVQLPPARPPLVWETLGRLRGPDGRYRITGHWGDPAAVVTLAEGDESPRGHRVARITAQTLELLHPDTQERLRFSLPQAPRFERR